MNLTTARRAALVAVATTGIAASATGASAATPPLPFAGLPFAAPTLPAGGFPSAPGLAGFTPAPLSFIGPAVGQIAAVIGPTVITTAPSNFVNTNLQTTAGSAVTGGQVGP
jgi:hypothetical protein